MKGKKRSRLLLVRSKSAFLLECKETGTVQRLTFHHEKEYFPLGLNDVKECYFQLFHDCLFFKNLSCILGAFTFSPSSAPGYASVKPEGL